MGAGKIGTKSLMPLIMSMLVLAACDRSGLDRKIWEFSGSDLKRGIEHYYSKPSVKKVGDGVVAVVTRGISKEERGVEQATGVKGAHDFEVKMEVACKDKLVRVVSKDYRDKDGISLLVENDGMNMDAVRPITPDMPLYKMYEDICR